MSIRTIQTRYKASSSPSTVLTTIDTNSPPPPPGLAAKVLYLNMTAPSSSQSNIPRSTSPKPLSANTSTLSPFASPYKPKLSRSSSLNHAQNQHIHQQSQRAGARAGRGIPAAPVEVSSMGTVGASSGAADPLFGGLPTYQSTSRFDPFGDFIVSESSSHNQYLSSPQPLLQSHPSSPPSGVTSFAFNVTINPSAATQQLGSGAGVSVKPAYNHYYYYDTATNSPTLAYGSPPVSSSQNTNNTRFNYNRSRTNPNHKARNNGSHYNSNNLNNNYNQGRRANSVVNSFNHSRPNSRSPSPPSPLTSPTKASFSSSTVAFPSQGSAVQDPFADPLLTAPVEPVPIRTRKRSNTISETSRSPSPPSPVPSRSPSPPSATVTVAPAPVIVEKKEVVKPQQPVTKLTTKKDSSAISKLVAAMLLNRVDAMGRSRCGKRANSCGTGYVKSGLSRVVFVE